MSIEEHKEQVVDDIDKRQVKPKYKSFIDMCAQIKRSLARRAIVEKLLSNSSFPTTIKYKPSNDEIIEVLMKKCNLVVVGEYEDAQLFIENPDTLDMISSVFFVEKILANISGSFKYTGNVNTEVKISIAKIQQTAREIYSILKHKSEIRQLV